MKENIIKSIIAAAIAFLMVYFGQLLIPLVILLIVMISDYISGMIGAWINKEISSRIGFIGIIKKACYMFVVAVGVIVDWVLKASIAGTDIIVNDDVFAVGLLVIIWLIINELISILENISAIGVPLPSFLMKIVHKLKKSVENETNKEENYS